MYTLIYHEASGGECDVEQFFFHDFDNLFEFLKNRYFNIHPILKVPMNNIFKDPKICYADKIKYGLIVSTPGVTWYKNNLKKNYVRRRLEDINKNPRKYRKINSDYELMYGEGVCIDRDCDTGITIVDRTDVYGFYKEIRVEIIGFMDDDGEAVANDEVDVVEDKVDVVEDEVANISIRQRFMRFIESLR